MFIQLSGYNCYNMVINHELFKPFGNIIAEMFCDTLCTQRFILYLYITLNVCHITHPNLSGDLHLADISFGTGKEYNKCSGIVSACLHSVV